MYTSSDALRRSADQPHYSCLPPQQTAEQCTARYTHDTTAHLQLRPMTVRLTLLLSPITQSSPTMHQGPTCSTQHRAQVSRCQQLWHDGNMPDPQPDKYHSQCPRNLGKDWTLKFSNSEFWSALLFRQPEAHESIAAQDTLVCKQPLLQQLLAAQLGTLVSSGMWGRSMHAVLCFIPCGAAFSSQPHTHRGLCPQHH
jgi:hypothetical protein